eukprot:TRINITY_DN332_c0_g1_i3.p1 TRINITY_DN332_c0_g1~~TRINITY_DN332_c0_g1_i3.p1  ORF type:complete len:366 (+),score=150.86 TRINITY_DN332_c0_g1_i3:59-1099(+)
MGRAASAVSIAIVAAICVSLGQCFQLAPSKCNSRSSSCRLQATRQAVSMGMLGRGGGREVRITTPDGEAVISRGGGERTRRPDLQRLDSEHLQADATLGYYVDEDEEEDEAFHSSAPAASSRQRAREQPLPQRNAPHTAVPAVPLRSPIVAMFNLASQIFVPFVIVQFFITWVRKGFSIRRVMAPELKWEYLVTEKEHIKELHAYRCEQCGYTLFPARNRHKKFFEDVKDYTCPECGAAKSEFVDIHDLTDPRNIDRPREELEAALAAKIKAEAEALAHEGDSLLEKAPTAMAAKTAAAAAATATTAAPTAPSRAAPAAAAAAAAEEDSSSSSSSATDGDDDDLLA